MAPRMVLMLARKTGPVPNPWPLLSRVSESGDADVVGAAPRPREASRGCSLREGIGDERASCVRRASGPAVVPAPLQTTGSGLPPAPGLRAGYSSPER